MKAMGYSTEGDVKVLANIEVPRPMTRAIFWSQSKQSQ
jgi:hypothetical protein